MVKNLPAMQETWVQSLGQEDTLEKGMATHSSVLAWRIPWIEESGRLQSMGHKELDTAKQLTLLLSFTLFIFTFFHYIYIYIYIEYSLPGGSVVNTMPANARDRRDLGLFPVLLLCVFTHT